MEPYYLINHGVTTIYPIAARCMNNLRCALRRGSSSCVAFWISRGAGDHKLNKGRGFEQCSIGNPGDEQRKHPIPRFVPSWLRFVIPSSRNGSGVGR
jgi:hypothetical protein